MQLFRNNITVSKPSHEGFGVLCTLCIAFVLVVLSYSAHAQENYEIQVYPSETMTKGTTMLELHSNFTSDGQRTMQEGTLPTHHTFHETIEVTHGFTTWFETGFYLFNAITSDNHAYFIGTHIRPRVMVPEKWGWPVGVSLSAEVGYQDPKYTPDDWALEIRPIIDKTWKKLYVSFNPTFERSLHGMNKDKGFEFSPNLKASYEVIKMVALGFEYYGAIGDISAFDPYQYRQQEHLLFAAVDLEFSPDWEFNAGYGFGLTGPTDNGILKLILGYRFHAKNKQSR